MTIDELMQWFMSNLDLVNRLSGDEAIFAMEFPDPESEGWRAGYKHWGDDGDTYFFENIVGVGPTSSAALQASYEKTRPLVAELQRLIDRWRPVVFEDLRVGDRVISYGLNWDGELTYSGKEVTGFPQKAKEWYAYTGRKHFESGKEVYGYQPKTFSLRCQIERGK
jgi:hypothetical protein